MTHLFRWTMWEDPDGGLRQATLTLLDADWEPMREVTLSVGPFDSPEEVRVALLTDMRRWIETYGIQPRLPV